MIEPAVCHKEELEQLFAKEIYKDEYFLYSGYCYSHCIPEIKEKDDKFQYAILDSGKRVIGYLSYIIDARNDTVLSFSLYSFDKGNPTIGKDLYKEMNKLVKEHRRIEWRMIGGNPVQKHYDYFCKKHSGNKVVLHEVCKDNHGIFRDEYIYEIIKN